MNDQLNLKPEIVIAGRRIARDTPVYIICEMACGHQGELAQALRLIDAAVESEADCVQLQIFDTKANMAPTAESYSLLEQIYFSPSQWQEIMAYARTFEIDVSIFAYDEPSLKLAIELKPDMLKLNSSELSNPSMLIGAAKSNLPFTLGTGASSMEEIKQAVEIILEHDGDQLILMHGVQNFPTPVSEANIKKINHLQNEFGGLIIYADHTDANSDLAHSIDLIAIGQGAALLEKHIVLDRSKKGVDWQAALEPAEFKKYVKKMRAAWSALGPYEFQPFSKGEKKYRRFQKKCMVAGREMKSGEIIRQEDVKFLRVQSEHEGIAPNSFALKAEGKKLNRQISVYEQILPEDYETP